MEAPAEIKVKTRKFSLTKGTIKISFELEGSRGRIRSLKLKQRNAVLDTSFPFEMQTAKKGNTIVYHAQINVDQYPMETAFWDVVASVDKEGKGNYEDAILGGLSSKLKLKLILFPRWTRTGDGHMVYPFVNGARQFTIQYRKYDPKYDSYAFIAKEFLALFCYFILKPYWDHKKLWLICEKYCTMAQDNGLYFFRYCMEHAPEKDRSRIFYVIDKKCPDYQAVKEYDANVIQFMSFKYMIYLSAARYLISTDAIRHFYIWDSPNSIYKVLYQARKNIVFLQHGVTALKRVDFFYGKGKPGSCDLFVVTSEKEKQIVIDNFDYEPDEVINTGFARWDVLKDKSQNSHDILVMPTWRSWLEGASDREFEESDYFRHYAALLNSQRFKDILEKYDLHANFYLHAIFQAHTESFHIASDRIHLKSFGDTPVNELLMQCKMLITDYSSVCWDVLYQNKPTLFYQFDLDKYNEAHGSYIDMKTDLFGDRTETLEQLLDSLEKTIQNNFRMEPKYEKMQQEYFQFEDHEHSRHICEEIKKWMKRK